MSMKLRIVMVDDETGEVLEVETTEVDCSATSARNAMRAAESLARSAVLCLQARQAKTDEHQE